MEGGLGFSAISLKEIWKIFLAHRTQSSLIH